MVEDFFRRLGNASKQSAEFVGDDILGGRFLGDTSFPQFLASNPIMDYDPIAHLMGGEKFPGAARQRSSGPVSQLFETLGAQPTGGVPPTGATAPVDQIVSPRSSKGPTITNGPGGAPRGEHNPPPGAFGNQPPQDPASDAGSTTDPVAAMPPNMRAMYDHRNANAARAGQAQPFTYNKNFQPQQNFMTDEERARANQGTIDAAAANSTVPETGQTMRMIPVQGVSPEELKTSADLIREYYAEQGIPTKDMEGLSDADIIDLWNVRASKYNQDIMATAAKERQAAMTNEDWTSRNPTGGR